MPLHTFGWIGILREIHRMLGMPSSAIYLTNSITSTDRLVDDCRVMISKTAASPELLAAAQAALQAAKDANKARNRVVHDMWLPAFAPDGTDMIGHWSLMQLDKRGLGYMDPGTPKDISFAESVNAELGRAGIRVFALLWALQNVLPFYQGGLQAEPVADWVAIMNDRFVTNPDGSFSVLPESDT